MKTKKGAIGTIFQEQEPCLTLSLPMPPSVNECYVNTKIRNKPRVKSPDYIKWVASAQNSLWTQEKRLIHGRVAVIYSFFVPDKRRRDCANYEKTLSDFLVKQRIIDDDKFIRWNLQEWLDDQPHASGVLAKIYKIN